MHREIMHAPKGMVVDHKKDNSLNNRRRNLRVCTQGQNRANSKPHGGRSGFKGVYPQGDKWYGVVERGGKQHYAGTFPTPAEAARARDRLALKLFGEYAWLNFPNEVRVVTLQRHDPRPRENHGDADGGQEEVEAWKRGCAAAAKGPLDP